MALQAVAQAQLAVAVAADRAHLALALHLDQSQRVLRTALHLHRPHQLSCLALKRQRHLGGHQPVKGVAGAQLRIAGGWWEGNECVGRQRPGVGYA